MIIHAWLPLPRDVLQYLHSLGCAPWTQTRWGSVVNAAARIAALPLSLGVELATLPGRIVWDEPAAYNPRGYTASKSAQPRGYQSEGMPGKSQLECRFADVLPLLRRLVLAQRQKLPG